MNTAVVTRLLDKKSLTITQVTVAALCALVAVLDGFDTQAIGYVAPAIVQSWGISKLALGPIFSASLVGAIVGTVMFGSLADRFGRRAVLIFCTLIFGAGALASTLAGSILTLSIWRFITGLGMGGAMPTAIAQTCEFMPRRLRDIMATLTYCGFALGAALGGVVTDWLIESFGWRYVFLVGGIVPLVIAAILIRWMPESIEYQLAHSGLDAKAASLLGRIGIAAEETRVLSTSDTVPPASASGIVRQLFAGGRHLFTPLLWLIIFMNMMQVYFFSNWLPTMIHGAGVTVGRAALITALFQLGGTVGAIFISVLITRFRKFRILTCVYSGAAFFVGSVGFLLARVELHPDSVALLAICVTLAGGCVVGGQIGVVAASTSVYPSEIRSSGVGWALGLGRLGSVLGPFLGSALIAARLDNQQLFLYGAVPVFFSSVFAFCIDRIQSPVRDDTGSISFDLKATENSD